MTRKFDLDALREKASACEARQMQFMQELFDALSDSRLVDCLSAADKMNAHVMGECEKLAKGPDAEQATRMVIEMDSRHALICANAFFAMAAQAVHHRLKHEVSENV
jgi:hypothetical protein